MAQRLYYPCQALGVAKFNDPINTAASWKTVRGLQSVGINTTFNLEQVFEIGQLAIYENIEQLPDVEVTAEKLIDEYAPLLSLTTQGATGPSLVARSNQRCHVALSIYGDTVSLASGTPTHQVVLSGMYLSQFSYDFTVDGQFKESVTLVGNNKAWRTGSFSFNGFTSTHGVSSLSPSETVARRQHFSMHCSRFPTNIPGISSSGTNNLVDGSTTEFKASFQNVKVSANLGRDNILELGHFAPYFRYVNFPVEIPSSFELIAKGGDLVDASEAGNNLTDQEIIIAVEEPSDSPNLQMVIDLGTKNKLQSVNYGGANAGARGGNATHTFNFVTFNDFIFAANSDPDHSATVAEYELP